MTKPVSPDFDKRGDDRRPVGDWRIFQGRPSAILIDAWCLGAQPERGGGHGAAGRCAGGRARPGWRLATRRERLRRRDLCRRHRRFDAVLFLRAPSFDEVLDWRCQQEADLLGLAPADLPLGERSRLAGFIQHFERVTRRMLDGGVKADVVVQLDRNRLRVPFPREPVAGLPFPAAFFRQRRPDGVRAGTRP